MQRCHCGEPEYQVPLRPVVTLRWPEKLTEGNVSVEGRQLVEQLVPTLILDLSCQKFETGEDGRSLGPVGPGYQPGITPSR